MKKIITIVLLGIIFNPVLGRYNDIYGNMHYNDRLERELYRARNDINRDIRLIEEGFAIRAAEEEVLHRFAQDSLRLRAEEERVRQVVAQERERQRQYEEREIARATIRRERERARVTAERERVRVTAERERARVAVVRERAREEARFEAERERERDLIARERAREAISLEQERRRAADLRAEDRLRRIRNREIIEKEREIRLAFDTILIDSCDIIANSGRDIVDDLRYTIEGLMEKGITKKVLITLVNSESDIEKFLLKKINRIIARSVVKAGRNPIKIGRIATAIITEIV